MEDKIILITDILFEKKLVKSKSEARRLIEQGAVSVEATKVESHDQGILKSDFIKRGSKGITIRIGKKRIHTFILPPE